MKGTRTPFRGIARRLLPFRLRKALVRSTRWPPVGAVDFGTLRRLKPLSTAWGGDRGLPVDRHYIERFLALHAGDIRGRVLEVGEDKYTTRFGGDRVARSQIVDADPESKTADYIADFSDAPELPSEAFDCIICTQTLQLIPRLRSSIETLYRILKPSGVLLATLPGISQLYQDEENRWPDLWRFTSTGARILFEEVFGDRRVEARAYGNVLTATAFLYGLAAEELTREELDWQDPQYEFLIAVRAQRTA